MGVTGLWTVVHPCARPIKLETLNKKRLAVDASIWIYQFLKAVRDKEGNALRNSHVVGFFRRICKLLFFGIKPVFVFDGGAPALKRQTITGRKQRREGRREDAARTAGKLLAVQMQRRAEEEERKRKDDASRPAREEEEQLPEELVYVDELQMTPQERQKNRQFKKKDAYHLPDLDVSISDMGAPNDPRIMSHEELEEYARQFHSGEDINLYDFSTIDFESPFFLSLPASDRYNIINAARLRSRLRMGYSKDQLDSMFPDRMAFSRFQIERVTERNELTQRLMNINGMNGSADLYGVNSGGRVAGEKGKEYVLVKNDAVEGGWALGVVSSKGEGKRDQPIDVDTYDQTQKLEDDENDEGWEDEEDDFEDVPVEGLNRLPKRPRPKANLDYNDDYRTREIAEKRKAVYDARRKATAEKASARPPSPVEDPNSLFVPETANDTVSEDEIDELFEDVAMQGTNVDAGGEDDDDDLHRAIQMSLESPLDHVVPNGSTSRSVLAASSGRALDFDQPSAKLGRAIAQSTNQRASKAGVPNTHVNELDDEESMDLQAALAESRRSKYQPTGPGYPNFQRPSSPGLSSHVSGNKAQESGGFAGPLPFESLNLGQSLLGKKKAKKIEEDHSGGFERNDREQSAQPLPPWFNGDGSKGKFITQQPSEEDYDEASRDGESRRVLHRKETKEVIDLDASQSREVINVDSSDEDPSGTSDFEAVDMEIRMDDIADLTRVEPPIPDKHVNSTAPASGMNSEEPDGEPAVNVESSEEPAANDEIIEWDPTDEEDNASPAADFEDVIPAGGILQTAGSASRSPLPEFEKVGSVKSVTITSDPGDAVPPDGNIRTAGSTSKSLTPEFEDVGSNELPEKALPLALKRNETQPDDAAIDASAFIIEDDEEDEVEETGANAVADEPQIKQEDDYYSDSDEELMKQLAVEAEEHARFASTLNQRSQAENIFDYERELKQLRNQQKKDRRDADEVSHIMITECQQLLRLFGLPYITAPMEAEAQCAELVSLGLVDGIVTDDSDIFLFGGTRVYKNMFNQGKFVECYLSNDLEKEYALTRRKLIRFAHLLGSDYTEGVPGIGPVTALEILTEFATLEDFRDWWTKSQMNISMPEDAHSTFRKKFKRNLAKLFLPPAFPDQRVDVAYLKPEVDSDPSLFQWGVPDLDALRAFLMATIGWTQERTDEVLVPVIKDMNRRENEGTQANITNFFSGGAGAGAFAPRRRAEPSGRMEKAFGRLRKQAERSRRAPEEDEVDEVSTEESPAVEPVVEEPAPKKAPGKGRGKKRSAKKRQAVEEDGVDGSTADDDGSAFEAAPKKRRRNGASKK